MRRNTALQGQQWVRMVVLGQSFMLHQIRKLVGTAVAVMRGDAPPDCIALALQPERSVVRPLQLSQYCSTNHYMLPNPRITKICT